MCKQCRCKHQQPVYLLFYCTSSRASLWPSTTCFYQWITSLSALCIVSRQVKWAHPADLVPQFNHKHDLLRAGDPRSESSYKQRERSGDEREEVSIVRALFRKADTSQWVSAHRDLKAGAKQKKKKTGLQYLRKWSLSFDLHPLPGPNYNPRTQPQTLNIPDSASQLGNHVKWVKWD